MANKIEIFENTLLKLLVRRGLDADRQNVVLTEGELGYTTDSKKLFVGDGQTPGGILIGGSKFWGSANSVTTFIDAAVGDTAFSTSDNTLYSYTGGLVNESGSWTRIGGIYSKGNNTINVNSANNQITVGTISAANITRDIIGDSLTLSNTNRITLSSRVAVNTIVPATGTTLTLPSSLNINNVTYNWPSNTGIQSSSYLRADITGNLSWTPIIDVTTSTFVYNSAGIIPVGSIMPFVSSANAPTGWLLCNGQLVSGALYPELSAVIGTTYGGDSTNFRVPNLINRTLYGVQNSPSSSTLYNIGQAQVPGVSPLSATGALFIIKAKPDGSLNSSLTVASPLTATLNGIAQAGTFNPLSGSVQIGLTPTLTSATTQLGPFVADEYGRVRNTPLNPAGTLNTPGPGTRPVYNGSCSPIGFFQTPPYIIAGGSFNSTVFTISAYPYITFFNGTLAGNPNFYSVPPNAKNLIVECVIDRQQQVNNQQIRIVAAAPNESLLLSPASSNVLGDTEFMVGRVVTYDKYEDYGITNQVIIPLSAKANGHLITSFRINESYAGDQISIRVVGYTL